jgi:hypothetical protein
MMVQQSWRESGDLHEPDPLVQRWQLYRAFDGGDGSGGQGWYWYVAGNGEGLTPCNRAEDQAGF